MATYPTDGMYLLSDLEDFRVAESEADPRGWGVVSSDDQKLGFVKELLVDVTQMTVRYLAIALDLDQPDSGSRFVLTPIGSARLDAERDRVNVNATAASVRGLPTYELGKRIDRAFEDAVLRGLGLAAVGTESEYYTRPEFATEKFYGSRFMGDTAAATETQGPIDSPETVPRVQKPGPPPTASITAQREQNSRDAELSIPVGLPYERPH
jgi:hypothetical protein